MTLEFHVVGCVVKVRSGGVGGSQGVHSVQAKSGGCLLLPMDKLRTGSQAVHHVSSTHELKTCGVIRRVIYTPQVVLNNYIRYP